jgi:transcription initiation factor TFIIIB Brf1 subunit/transcription initiation factor TFIIB
MMSTETQLSSQTDRLPPLNAQESKPKSISSCTKVHQGGVGKFAAQQEINDNNQKKIPELRNLLDKAKKVEAKAQKALEEFGSELDRILQQLGLPSAD